MKNNFFSSTFKYFLLTIYSGLLGYIFSVLLSFVNQSSFSQANILLFILSGVIVGIIMIFVLKHKYNMLCFFENIRLLRILFLQTNLFFGGVVGFIAGVIFSWLLIFPFGLVFGHPDTNWSFTATYLFEIVSILIMIICFLFFSYWCFKNSIVFLERKAGNQK